MKIVPGRVPVRELVVCTIVYISGTKNNCPFVSLWERSENLTQSLESRRVIQGTLLGQESSEAKFPLDSFTSHGSDVRPVGPDLWVINLGEGVRQEL